MQSALTILAFASAACAWLPQDRDLAAFNMTARFEQLGKRYQPTLGSGVSKIRGVNFGGWLISEPWMMCNEWQKMGCATSCNGNDQQKTEFDCMRNVYGGDREAGNQAFENHWKEWINADTVQSVHDVGLNTIRIPIGYWSYPDIVDSSEPFAEGGERMMQYVDAVVQKAADLGIYVIIDFHGAPGGQQLDAFTGQFATNFFSNENYIRGTQWLTWMTQRIHSNPAYASTGMIEVLNEPVSNHDYDDGNPRYPKGNEDSQLQDQFYPSALKAIRKAEDDMGISSDKRLHVQFMDSKWGSGNPRSSTDVQNDATVAFDDHNYIKYSVDNTKDALLQSACTDDRTEQGEAYKITGEWTVSSAVDPFDDNWNKQFFTAQQQLYEAPGMAGWVYWAWKTELNDPTWTYSWATQRGWIPTGADALEKNVYQDVCQPWR